jgi:hypothetical protein
MIIKILYFIANNYKHRKNIIRQIDLTIGSYTIMTSKLPNLILKKRVEYNIHKRLD